MHKFFWLLEWALLTILIKAQTNVDPQQQQPHRRFEYKHSFKGPNLAQKDGTIPFWQITGDALASAEQLRLAPSIRSKQGAAWNTKPFASAEFWEVQFSFKVVGQGRIGADGLAFWYTALKGAPGPTFGSNNFWTGLGVFFDSFDNDAQRNNPYVLAMVNDGTKSFDHNSDGSTQQVAGCQKDFRNRPFPVKARISYYKNVLTILIHDGMTQQERWELCMRVENIFLPKNGYFGLSAATGGLADDHDVISFMVNSLKTPDQMLQDKQQKIPEAEQKKFDQEFEKYWKEFEEEKQKFRKEHPDKVKTDDMDASKLYEDALERELRLIYEGQNTIHLLIRQLEEKLTSIIQQQLQHTTLINGVANMRQGGGAVQQQGGVPPAPSSGGGGDIQRHETNELLQLLREAHAASRDIKSYTTDIHTRIINIETKMHQIGANQNSAGVGVAQPIGGGGAGGAFEFQTIKGYLEGIKHDVEQVRINQRGVGVNPCPQTEGTCLTLTIFLVVIAAQSIFFMIYFLLKGTGEKAKFY